MNHLLSVLALIILITPTHASTPQVYWHAMLPNAPMPRAILDLISFDELDKDKFNVDLRYEVDALRYNGQLYVEDQVHDAPNATLFFFEKDLNPGSKFDLQFTKMTSGSPLISRSQVKPMSITAYAMNKTLVECEMPALDGESKLCATSLESMVEFSMMNLGTRDLQASSTMVKKKSGDVKVKKTYSVAPDGVRVLDKDELVVVCHSEQYPYTVFYCHTTGKGKSKAYTIALEGNDGTKVEAIAVCHLDTSKWNPKHLAFQILKVKRGRVPICHFMPEDNVTWTIKK
ncbi:BURP domain-containing protein [Dioscorea alata]|uniref:BURP domain-containing protein n=1 Tax=Dioscorea alata TaxID=55571 RepID=A0ACB7WPL3_DIOAL|nr:BURP domain-containing protein [Dioscorea alata]